MMELLKWDSNFFGFPICKITINTKKLEFVTIKNYNCNLIYVFSKKEIDDFIPIDVKLTFKKSVHNVNPENSIIYYDYLNHLFSELFDLVLLSGKYSRFKLDSNFPDGSFKELYRKWIMNALELQYPLGVYVKIIDNQIAGFITIEPDSDETLKIGLIAVNPKFQGRGIASQLINKAQEVTFKEKKVILRVATQQHNQIAINLYKKNGFELDSKIYIYHIWK